MTTDIKKLGKTHKLSNCELTRVDIDTDHYYFINGEFAMSLTYMLDIGGPFPEGLRQWLRNTDGAESLEYMNMTKDRGSKLHDALERLMNGLELDLIHEYPTKYEKDAITTFIKTMKFLRPSQFKTELTVADPKRKVAGTMDFVGIVDKRRLELLLDPTPKIVDTGDEYVSLVETAVNEPAEPIKIAIDYKFTGRSSYSHKVQVGAYAWMYNNSYKDDQPVARKFIWRYSPQHKFHFEMKESTLGLTTYSRIYDTAIEYLGGFPKPPEIIAYPDKVRLLEEVQQS